MNNIKLRVYLFLMDRIKVNINIMLQHMWVIDQVCGQDGWTLAKFFFCAFMDRDGVALTCECTGNEYG